MFMSSFFYDKDLSALMENFYTLTRIRIVLFDSEFNEILSYPSGGHSFCSLMRTNAGVPAEMLDIIQAVIFLFFAAEQFLARYRQKLVVKGAREEMKQAFDSEAAAKGGNA